MTDKKINTDYRNSGNKGIIPERGKGPAPAPKQPVKKDS
ncbi:hypothetical protein HMPREF9269_0399 [Ligilactobacillus salivarius ACS-116-V-Col5a]|jgi:hypothetical protein|nr:hypothetical protein HMPREF9269_0399 [Ligilactobacillus salivarius ACS-116-V-Col5a]DAT97922.1 MAG TPA: hypothetical protein [Caudoviricetes sp.]